VSVGPDRGPELGRLLRELAPAALGSIVRRFRDFSASEDALQEALLAAATQWPREGVPDQPVGWLVRVAARRIADAVRSEVARSRREALVVSLVPPEEQLAFPPELDAPDEERGGDDTLVLLFMCCHPALSTSSAIALTLRAVGGLTTAEIARAFLVPEATMAQRISRAKQSIKASQVPFQLPTAEERAARLGAVLHVLYLIFNEGYTASSGAQLVRDDLASEAIRLTRALYATLQEPAKRASASSGARESIDPGIRGEVAGLLALMLLTDARRAARTGPAGELIPLDEQDRTLWDAAAIVEGIALVPVALSSSSSGAGEYAVQAAIAALHNEAPRVADTDWPQILALYDVLVRFSDSPMASLGRAVATAMVHGPAAGLALLPALEADARLAGSHRIDAVRGHLLERAGPRDEAIAAYVRAAARTPSTPERHYLLTRAARLRDEP
jgi:predicted RNA polymerase sigma factor